MQMRGFRWASEGKYSEIEQTITQPADLEVGPVKVGDASVLTWTNTGIIVVLIAAIVIGKKLLK